MTTQPVKPANSEIKSYVERIERLLEEKKGLQSDIKDLYLEAKSQGHCPKALKKIIKLRTMREAEINEESNMVLLYARELGLMDANDEATPDLAVV